VSRPAAASALATLLHELLDSRLDESGRRWWAGAASAVGDGGGELAERFTSASRRAGKRALALAPAQRTRLAREGVDWPVTHWAIDDLARVTLLLLSASARPLDHDVVETCYREGDNRERRAVLFALPLLPVPEAFVELAVEACRTHVQPVFDAIACENPYPARHFPEPAFNQMTLKAVFTGVALERIVGLRSRATAELARMAADYASERRAAGRPVPADLILLMAAKGSEQ
jgi:hypothetical protein